METTNLNLNLTTSKGAEPLFQEALNRHIITRSKAKLVHHQFGQKTKIPKGKTKTITWDKLNPLPKAKTPLTEGVTPTGTAINISRITATPLQYGAYISTSDEFDFYKNDPSPEVLKINEILADNAGETQDSLTADILSTGTNVQYAGEVTSRSQLDPTKKSAFMNVEEIRKAVRTLKKNKAQPIDKDYVAIIDPDVAFDLMSDPAWEAVKTYADPKDMYAGEIGRLYGVRFVETTEAKVFMPPEIVPGVQTLTIASLGTGKIIIEEEIDEKYFPDLAQQMLWSDYYIFVVFSVEKNEKGQVVLNVDSAGTPSVGVGRKIYSTGGAMYGSPVHSTIILGKDAYGVTDPKQNLETIIKPLGSAGSADPLNQRGTMGWKCHHLAKILVDEYMVRIESLSSGDATVKV